MNSGTSSVRFDAGWLFVVVGLAVCAAGVLIPAQNDLARTHQQLSELKRQESVANDRLAAHTDFLAELDRADPALVERLAAAQLNLMREGDKPLLMASTAQLPVTDWIDATVPARPSTNLSLPRTALTSLATGPHRLWFLASGVLCVFIGLLLDRSLLNQPRPRPRHCPSSGPRRIDHRRQTLADDWGAARFVEDAVDLGPVLVAHDADSEIETGANDWIGRSATTRREAMMVLKALPSADAPSLPVTEPGVLIEGENRHAVGAFDERKGQGDKGTMGQRDKGKEKHQVTCIPSDL